MVATISLIAFKNVGYGGDFIESKKHSRNVENNEEKNDNDHDPGHVDLRCHSAERRKSLLGDCVDFVVENTESDDGDDAGGQEGVENLIDDAGVDEVFLMLSD